MIGSSRQLNERTPRRTIEAESRRSEMEALLDALPDTRDTRQLLDAVVRGASQFFGAEAAVAFLFQDGTLTPAAWVGLQPQILRESPHPPPGDLRAYVSRFLPSGACRHLMRGSLLRGDHSLGELVVCSSSPQRHHYGPVDRELMATMAQQVAALLERTLEAERAEGQQGAVSRIARALVKEAGLSDVAERAVELAISEMKADASAVWLARPEEGFLSLLAQAGFSAEFVNAMGSLRLDSFPLASLVVSPGETQGQDEPDQVGVRDLTRMIVERSALGSAVAVPLMAHGRLVGVFALAKKSEGDWAEDERELVTTMSALLASSLLNLRLFEEAERQSALSQSLTTTLTDINEQLAKLGKHSGEMAEIAQQRAAELEATLENLADAVFVCDVQGKILLINDAGLEMIGVGRRGEELKTLGDYLAAARVRNLDGEQIPPDELAIARALRGEVVRGVQEIVYDARTGRDRYIIVSAVPIRGRMGALVGAVETQSDITRLKELDILKDQFITVAAHEIKTPVTAIKGFAQTLLRGASTLDAKQQIALEAIVRQSDRIDALVKDFLEMSRMRAGRVGLSPRRIHLTELVAEAVERMGRGSVNHTLSLSRADDVWIEGEVEGLQEVLMNLLDNAIRYSPLGGEVEVQVVREDGEAVVSVRDEGVGIPVSRQRNLFERFYRAHIGTSLDYGGLGVGLYISREIIRHHSGELWFQSQEGKGSTFYFSLPLAG